MTVHYDVEGPVAVVTIDRPQARNAVDRPTADALVAANDRFEADDDLAVMVLTGRPVAADEALRMGLVTRVVPSGSARAEAVALASEIAALPQVCLRSDRASLYAQWDLPLDRALTVETEHGMSVLRSEDALAGADRFARGAGRHGASAS